MVIGKRKAGTLRALWPEGELDSASDRGRGFIQINKRKCPSRELDSTAHSGLCNSSPSISVALYHLQPLGTSAKANCAPHFERIYSSYRIPLLFHPPTLSNLATTVF